VLGLVGGKVKAASSDIPEALERLLAFVEEPAFLSVYCGADATDETTAKIEEILSRELPDAELTVLDGGQPLYDYVIAVE
jgi:dihydroxyacetone kinase-like predicted kinase